MKKTLLTAFIGITTLLGCQSSDETKGKIDSLSALDTTTIPNSITEVEKNQSFTFVNQIYFSRGYRMNFTGNTILFLENNVCLINGDIRHYEVLGNRVTTNDENTKSHNALDRGEFMSGSEVEKYMQQDDTGLFEQYRLRENRKNPVFAIVFSNKLFCLRPMGINDEDGLRNLKLLYENKVYKVLSDISFQNEQNIPAADRSIISNKERGLTPGGEEAYNELVIQYQKLKEDFNRNLKELQNIASIIQSKSLLDFYQPSELLKLSKKIREIKNFNWLYEEYISAVSSDYPLNTAILEQKRHTIESEQ